MMRSWIFSSGVRLSFVIAMKSHIGLVGIMRSISDQSRIKGMASTEEEAYRRIRESNPGLLICSDLLQQGHGFSLCRRAIQVVSDLKVLMVLSSEDLDVGSALDSGAMAVVCEEDFLSPEMEVMQSLLAAANNKKYVSNRARSRMKKPESIVESPQSLTQREKEILILQGVQPSGGVLRVRCEGKPGMLSLVWRPCSRARSWLRWRWRAI